MRRASLFFALLLLLNVSTAHATPADRCEWIETSFIAGVVEWSHESHDARVLAVLRELTERLHTPGPIVCEVPETSYVAVTLFTSTHDQPTLVVSAAFLLAEPNEVIRGLVAHEFAHAVQYRQGIKQYPRTTKGEIEVDMLAARWVGVGVMLQTVEAMLDEVIRQGHEPSSPVYLEIEERIQALRDAKRLSH